MDLSDCQDWYLNNEYEDPDDYFVPPTKPIDFYLFRGEDDRVK